MLAGARTPEELETLFEDAFLLRDQQALAQLFEAGAILVAGDGLQEARGGEEIARVVAGMWRCQRTYLAEPRRVLQARETALILAAHAIHVVCRGEDGWWRYAISFLDLHQITARDE